MRSFVRSAAPLLDDTHPTDRYAQRVDTMAARTRRRILGSSFALCATAIAPSAHAGTWTPLVHPATFVTDTALLLTDGSVMMHDWANGQNWWRLEPDVHGNYVEGTWSQVASMPSGYAPLFFASAVLPDGRVLVEGGEYNGNEGQVNTNLGAIYNPATNTWTSVAPPSGWANVGDAPAAVLANGTFVMGAQPTKLAALFDATTLTWTTTGTNKAEDNNEEGWTLLPSGDLLAVDTNNGTESELYDPTTGAWSLAGSTIVTLPPPLWWEVGPAVLMTNGTVFATGNTNTALYGEDGQWTVGPTFPVTSDGQVIAADSPAALLTNGNVLVATAPGVTTAGVHFFEFNGTSLTEMPRTPNAPNVAGEDCRFLELPSGQILATDGSTEVEIYTPSGAPNPAWAPTIASVANELKQGESYVVSGTQFNGLSQGASFGDDAQMATNYPLVRVTMNATGDVYYFKTHDHSTMGVATGSALVSTTFDVPAPAKEIGAAELQVVANGIASNSVAVCLPQTEAQACADQCSGTAADGCGGKLTCMTLSGARCCIHLGGAWSDGRCE